jgi:aspartate aminotransferase-like enzyme
VPDGRDWTALDRQFRERGLAVGGNYGRLAGKVFRLGHMGTQADERLVATAMDVIREVLRSNGSNTSSGR